MTNKPSLWLGDLASMGIVAATFSSILPPLAALLTDIWTGLRIYETCTVQRLLAWMSLWYLKRHSPTTIITTNDPATPEAPKQVVIVKVEEHKDAS